MASVEEHLAAIVRDRDNCDRLREEKARLAAEMMDIAKFAIETPRKALGLKRRLARITEIDRRLSEIGQ